MDREHGGNISYLYDEQCILVDEEDKVVGAASKLASHQWDGGWILVDNSQAGIG